REARRRHAQCPPLAKDFGTPRFRATYKRLYDRMCARKDLASPAFSFNHLVGGTSSLFGTVRPSILAVEALITSLKRRIEGNLGFPARGIDQCRSDRDRRWRRGLERLREDGANGGVIPRFHRAVCD